MAKGLLNHSFFNCLLLQLWFYHPYLPVASRFLRPNEMPQAWPTGTRNPETEVNQAVRPGIPQYHLHDGVGYAHPANYLSVPPPSTANYQLAPTHSWAASAPYEYRGASAYQYNAAAPSYQSGASIVPRTSNQIHPSRVYQHETNRNEDPHSSLPSTGEFQAATYGDPALALPSTEDFEHHIYPPLRGRYPS